MDSLETWKSHVVTLKSDTLIHSIIFIYHFLPLRFEPISSALRYKKEKSVMTQPFPKFHQILKDAQARSWQVYYNFKIAPRTEARSANTNSEVINRLFIVNCLFIFSTKRKNQSHFPSFFLLLENFLLVEVLRK